MTRMLNPDVAIDVRSKAVIGLFQGSLHDIKHESQLPPVDDTDDVSVEGIYHALGELLVSKGMDYQSIRGIGLVTGTQNQGNRLKQGLEIKLDKPVFLERDSNAAAMAEWNVHQHESGIAEILYWVIGSQGFGTALVQGGDVSQRRESWGDIYGTGHWTNEGGIFPIADKEAEATLRKYGIDHRKFLDSLESDVRVPEYLSRDKVIRGRHHHYEDAILAMHFLSTEGLRRLYNAHGPTTSTAHVPRSSEALQQIIEKYEAGDGAAVSAMKAFGTMLGFVGSSIIRAAMADGAGMTGKRYRGKSVLEIPIFVGGEVAQALEYFLPFFNSYVRRNRLYPGNEYVDAKIPILRYSAIEERGLNAQLLGAAMVARRGYESMQSGETAARQRASALSR